MTTSNSQLALIPSSETMTVIKGIAQTFVLSGFFKDTNEISQAMVKIMLGSTIGVGPVESMMGINIIQGKIALSAGLMAAKIKASEKYNYRVIEQTDQKCTIEFFEHGQSVGTASFSLLEAEKAGLTGKATWKQYPGDMMFARALSRGARRHCPDAFSSVAVYTAEELGATVNPETGEMIDPPSPAPTPPQQPIEFTEGEVVEEKTEVPVASVEKITNWANFYTWCFKKHMLTKVEVDKILTGVNRGTATKQEIVSIIDNYVAAAADAPPAQPKATEEPPAVEKKLPDEPNVEAQVIAELAGFGLTDDEATHVWQNSNGYTPEQLIETMGDFFDQYTNEDEFFTSSAAWLDSHRPEQPKRGKK